MSSDTPLKTWTPTSPLSGKPIGITQLVYANGIYLACIDEHSGHSGNLTTVLICDDLVNWQHRTTNLADYELRNAKITTHEDCFVAVATTKNKVVAFTSINGFDWEKSYETLDTSDLYSVESIFSVSGRLAVGCIGSLFLTSDGTAWSELLLPEAFNTATVLGSGSIENIMYFLLNQNDNSYLAKTTDGVDFDIQPVPWEMESLSITDNGSQILVSCRTEGKCCVIFFSDDITSYEVIDITIPIDKTMNEFATVHDMLWVNNEWIFTCNREFYNSAGMKFSVTGYTLRSNGMLTTDSSLVQDIVGARNLTTIKILNGQLIAFGNAFPTPDNCLYTVVE